MSAAASSFSPFTEEGLAPLPSFNIQCAVVPSVDYLAVNGSRAVDIRTLLAPQRETFRHFSDNKTRGVAC